MPIPWFLWALFSHAAVGGSVPRIRQAWARGTVPAGYRAKLEGGEIEVLGHGGVE